MAGRKQDKALAGASSIAQYRRNLAAQGGVSDFAKALAKALADQKDDLKKTGAAIGDGISESLSGPGGVGVSAFQNAVNAAGLPFVGSAVSGGFAGGFAGGPLGAGIGAAGGVASEAIGAATNFVRQNGAGAVQGGLASPMFASANRVASDENFGLQQAMNQPSLEAESMGRGLASVGITADRLIRAADLSEGLGVPFAGTAMRAAVAIGSRFGGGVERARDLAQQQFEQNQPGDMAFGQLSGVFGRMAALNGHALTAEQMRPIIEISMHQNKLRIETEKVARGIIDDLTAAQHPGVHASAQMR